jgi:STE24 endopeptidase
MTGNMTVVSLICALLILQGVVEFILLFLNQRKIVTGLNREPSQIADYFTKENWRQCSLYNIEKSKFAKVNNFCGLIFSLVILYFIFPFFWGEFNIGRDAGIWGVSSKISLLLVILQLTSLFSDWYFQFKIEEKFGFNNQTISLWLTDKLKESLISFGLITVMLALIIFLYRSLSVIAPNSWWLWTCAGVFVVQVLLMIIWPSLILPLFNKITPLEDASLKEKLENLSLKTGFVAQKIEVMDGSKRSGHSNAFFTGFGKFRRIILFDTLIDQMNENEVEAVVAHEIGHYRKGHIPKRLFLSFGSVLLILYLIHLSIQHNWVVDQFNLGVSMSGSIAPTLLTIILFGGAFTFWIKPVSNILSRKHEYEADLYAASMIDNPSHLRSALKKLCVENLSYPLPHILLAWFHHSHPTIPERDQSLSGTTS